MSYVDGSDSDYGGDYPSEPEAPYDYTSFGKSANSLEYSMSAKYGTDNYSRLNEPSCSEQEIRFKAPLAAAFADDSNKPLWTGVANQQLDQSIKKWQGDFQADPSKYSLQCFGPPTIAPDVLGRPLFPAMPEKEHEDIFPATPEDLPEKGLPMSPFDEANPGAPRFRRGVVPLEWLPVEYGD